MYSRSRVGLRQGGLSLARLAKTSIITPVTPVLISNHLFHIRREREGWHRNSTVCSVVTFLHAKSCLKRPSAICLTKIVARSQRGTSTPSIRHRVSPSSWAPAPRRRGTPHGQHVSPSLSYASFRLARPPLRNVCAEAYLADCTRAPMDGDVGGGILRRDYCQLGGRAPRDATSGIYCIIYYAASRVL
jgi:hypothetical protein